MSACTCTRYRIAGPDGEILEGELERDPDCRQHGFPMAAAWPAGHPLRVHAREVETVRIGPVSGHRYVSRRLETPRETEARLYQEMREASGNSQARPALEGKS